MRSRTIIAILATCALGLPTLAAEMPVTPYAGQQVRQVKALSDEDIAAHRKGEGMGMAKAAELNYPGPAHFGELHLAENFDAVRLGLISSPITRVVRLAAARTRASSGSISAIVRMIVPMPISVT